MEESVKKEQRQYWAVNRTFHSSMFEEVFKVGVKVIFYTISLEELKEISENTPINMRFLGNGVPYKNALDKVGVKYKTITDDVVLSPSRKDVLYTIIGNTTVKEDQTEFPDYTIIEVYVCEICR